MARPAKEGLFRVKNSQYWYCRFYLPTGQLKRCSTKKEDYQSALDVYYQLRLEAECEHDHNERLTVNKILTVYDQIRGQYLRGRGGYEKGTKQILLFYDNIEWEQLGVRGGAYATHAYITKRITADGVKPGTVNREISILSAAANIAIEDGYEIENYWQGKKQPVIKHQYHWLTTDQAKALLKASQRQGASIHLYDYLQIALGTGMRMSEILSLECRDIRLDINEIWLRTSKSGQPHTIPMTNNVRLSIQNRLKHSKKHASSFLFYNSASKKRLKTIIKPFKTACAVAGIPVSDKKRGIQGVRLHDTRHTVGAWLIQNGASIEQVADLLNHSDIRTTQIYAHHAVDARKGVVGKLPEV